jgi:hypothetical protein
VASTPRPPATCAGRGRVHLTPRSWRGQPEGNPVEQRRVFQRTGAQGPRRYTDGVRSVADELRARTVAQVLALPVPDRIELALTLGDDDLALFLRTSGMAPGAALGVLRAQRQRRRIPSASAQGGLR